VKRTRAENYALLVGDFEAHTYDRAGESIERYAAVAEEFFDEQRVGAKISLCDTEQAAFGILGNAVLEGYAPDGVYDLDTTDKIAVRVSAVVTRAEEQDCGYNWLQEVDRAL
jgi:hypothetical protein